MSLTYFEISYPNFVLGAIIDPVEANQNNHDIVTKTNLIVDAINANQTDILSLLINKAEKIYVDAQDTNLAGVGRTVETIKANYDALVTHKASADHDGRYYTKTLLEGGQLDNRYFTETEINAKITVINNSVIANATSLNTHRNSLDHDGRYYTKEELSAFLRSGDTSIKREVFTIVNSDNLDNTFTYIDGDSVEHVGMLLENGEQVFTLIKGFYQLNLERIEVTINDTLNRTSTSGGLMEISPTEFALTSPEQNGAEITVKYYEKIGLAGVSIIHYGNVVPDGYAMWYKVV